MVNKFSYRYMTSILFLTLLYTIMPSAAYAHTEQTGVSVWQNGWFLAGTGVGGLAIIGWIAFFYWRKHENTSHEGLSRKEVRSFKQEANLKKRKALGLAITATLLSLVLFGVYSTLANPKMTWEDLRSGEAIDVESFADQGRDHIQSVNQEHIAYNSSPPTSGPHFVQWAKYGFYEEPIAPEILVHNLEHGDIVIYYRQGLDEQAMGHLRALSQITKEGSGVLVVPFSDENGKDQAAATAWTKLMKLPQLDEAKLETFIHRFIYQGPEKLPPQH
jgi:hypothetical protein